MEPTPGPPPSEPRASGAADRARGQSPPAGAPSPRAVRIENHLKATEHWLQLVQDGILVAVAVLMLLVGVFVIADGVTGLIGTLTVNFSEGAFSMRVEGGRAVVDVAENALLALILAELVGTLLLSMGGKPLTVQPFLIIAIVAVVRHLLIATVAAGDDPIKHTLELLGMGLLILLLVVALVLMQWRRARDSAPP